MCIYVRAMPLCGHPAPTLLSYASCGAVLAQLLRIAEPEAWADPAALARAPFDLPDACGPREGANIWTWYSGDYCGWECRNNAYLVREALDIHDGGGSSDEDEGDVRYGGAWDCRARGGILPAYVPGDDEEEGVSCVLGGRGRGRGRDSGAGGAAYRVNTGGGGLKEPMVMGMPDARYGPGSERLGIGWRSD